MGRGSCSASYCLLWLHFGFGLCEGSSGVWFLVFWVLRYLWNASYFLLWVGLQIICVVFFWFLLLTSGNRDCFVMLFLLRVIRVTCRLLMVLLFCVFGCCVGICLDGGCCVAEYFGLYSCLIIFFIIFLGL